MIDNLKIGIVGLGYVGLPLAIEFAKKYNVVGFDISESRIRELREGNDHTLEADSEMLRRLIVESSETSQSDSGLLVSSHLVDLAKCNFYIITVPTPVDQFNRPILTPLIRASETVGNVLKIGDFVVYESTVFPGATEEECLPILEKVSDLKLNKDFFLGYSPERINPGDREHTVTKIKKVTAGSTAEASAIIDKVYRSIIVAGTHLAPSIKVAEAAKVIENSQRDINIAFVNELAKICSLLDIDTQSVLEAASTKWNFLNFKPGIVGGHCIGVDPYYLAQKAQEYGYNPEIILSGRRINDSMGGFIADQVIKALIDSGKTIKNAKVIILGFTFKENCPDFRNTGVIGIFNRLNEFGLNITIYDPWVKIVDVQHEYGVKVVNQLPKNRFDAIVLAVSHSDFEALDIERFKKSHDSIVYDVKGKLKCFTHRL
ncbi:nucleotide sugar dehydrogenase [Akkermansiaceae bacterium]|nr:nucleotide sugar dehydrogenase [Akkermansiaceae bacterium]